MPYDPQRSRPRPQVSEAEPAPVDALLGAPEVPAEPVEAPADEVAAEPRPAGPAGAPGGGPEGAPAPGRARATAGPGDPAAPAAPPAPAGGRARPLALLVGAGVLVALVLWLRRRRRR